VKHSPHGVLVKNADPLRSELQTVTNELEARPTVKKQKLLAPTVHKLSSRQKAMGRERSIAVLPFGRLSDNKNDSYFADGVHDEILSNS
jgi:hypothetical protein